MGCVRADPAHLSDPAFAPSFLSTSTISRSLACSALPVLEVHRQKWEHLPTRVFGNRTPYHCPFYCSEKIQPDIEKLLTHFGAFSFKMFLCSEKILPCVVSQVLLE